MTVFLNIPLVKKTQYKLLFVQQVGYVYFVDAHVWRLIKFSYLGYIYTFINSKNPLSRCTVYDRKFIIVVWYSLDYRISRPMWFIIVAWYSLDHRISRPKWFIIVAWHSLDHRISRPMWFIIVAGTPLTIKSQGQCDFMISAKFSPAFRYRLVNRVSRLMAQVLGAVFCYRNTQVHRHDTVLKTT